MSKAPERGSKSSPETGVGRRSFLRRTAFGAAALALPWPRLEFLETDLRAAAAVARKPAQSLIHVFLAGGLSQLDSFDPKPYAPVEVRGDWKAIPTALDGVLLSEQLPEVAKILPKIALVRSMTHSEAAHERGTHSMLTGYQPSQAMVYPSFGSVISHELSAQNAVPSYIAVPNANEIFLGSGYLGSAYGPFALGSDPQNENYRVRDLDAGAAIDKVRLERRKRLLGGLDDAFTGDSAPDSIEAMEAFYAQAWRLVDAPAAQAAFDIRKEPGAMRQRYGRTSIGQRLLLARRLTAAGARCVTVLDGGYDNHENLYTTLKRKLQDFDRGFAALIQDLEASGQLDSTIVLVSSEFGRTPRLNQTGGRDHWAKVFTTVLAGGGLKKGLVVGSSDASGAEPEDRPVSPAELAATIYARLGIDPAKKLMTDGGRPIDLVRDGRPIGELIG